MPTRKKTSVSDTKFSDISSSVPQPREGEGVSGVVGDSDGESVGRVCLLHRAVLGEQVLAASLEVEDLPVEGLVVGVPEHRAHALGTGRGWGYGATGRAAFT